MGDGSKLPDSGRFIPHEYLSKCSGGGTDYLVVREGGRCLTWTPSEPFRSCRTVCGSRQDRNDLDLDPLVRPGEQGRKMQGSVSGGKEVFAPADGE